MLKPLLVSIEISRPHNMLAAAFAVAVGYYVSGGRDAAAVVPAAVFTALVTGAGNVVNDYFDAHIDLINKPRRPIPSQRLSAMAALRIYVAATVLIAVGAVILLPPSLAVLVVAWQVSLFVYARWAKRVFIVGNLLVASVAASAFAAGGLVAGRVGTVVVPIVIAFLFVLSRELVKGAEDVAGDMKAGVRTMAVVIGVDRTVHWASGLMLGLVILIPIPALTSYYGELYFWVMELAVVPGLLAGAYFVLNRPDRRIFSRVSWILKLEMFFGVLAVGLGKF